MTINYVDRNSLSVLKTTLQKALSFLWSLVCMAHGLMRSVVGFAIARFLLGAAEATSFPAANKAIAQWNPQNERALAFGLLNSGTNAGVMISFSVVWLALLAGATIQWLGNQQPVFIWAGLMHPISWIILYLAMGREFKLVDITQPLDLSRPKRSLQLGGLIGMGIGVACTALIGLNWATCAAAARSTSAVAAAITAAAGIAVIGAFVYYAGMGHQRMEASTAQ
jgi:hypothetical protein